MRVSKYDIFGCALRVLKRRSYPDRVITRVDYGCLVCDLVAKYIAIGRKLPHFKAFNKHMFSPQIIGIEYNGHRPVVNELDLHVSSEFPRPHIVKPLRFKQ